MNSRQVRLVAESRKKAVADNRGRFNLGETGSRALLAEPAVGSRAAPLRIGNLRCACLVNGASDQQLPARQLGGRCIESSTRFEQHAQADVHRGSTGSHVVD